MKRLPPHIAWPLFIVGFLALGITWSISVVVASQSDGGAAVIDNYYEKAVAWDNEASLRAYSNQQGWRLAIDRIDANPPRLVILITSTDGTPATGLAGTLKALRPQKSSPVLQRALTESIDTPGQYSVPFSEFTPGLWDFAIDARRDTILVYTTVRKEF